MEINSVITLEDDLVCDLLDKVEYNNENFFLAEILEDEKPTGKYAILKETKENEDYYMEKVTDANLLLEVLKLYTEKFAKLVGNITVEELLDQ